MMLDEPVVQWVFSEKMEDNDKEETEAQKEGGRFQKSVPWLKENVRVSEWVHEVIKKVCL